MLKMGHSFFNIVAGISFAIAALFHGYHAYKGFDLIYGDWVVPLWLSWLVALVAFIMALVSLRKLK